MIVPRQPHSEWKRVGPLIPIMRDADASVLTAAARRNGMRNLREEGWMKIRDGVTTGDEAMRAMQEF